MSALKAAQARLEQLKTEAAGKVDVTTDDSLQVAEAGAIWLKALLDRHGLDMDDAMEVAQSLADTVAPNLAFMVAEKRLDPRASLVASVGAGFWNGLGVALELEDENLAAVIAAAEKWKGELLKQAAVYEDLANKERARLYGNPKAGASDGKPYETGHDKVVDEYMRDHIRPLSDAITALRRRT